jgi:dTDP-4-amino-4,6-dideoxygalactose transaminase
VAIMIPFVDLARRHNAISEEVEAALLRVARGGHYILGPEVEGFERAFAHFLGGGYVIGVSSGTDAITLALLALDIGPGDEVLTVANTCMPTVSGIRASGAGFCLADCDRNTRLLEVEAVERTLSARTKAVVAVHLYGHLCDGPRLAAVCRAHGVALLEDCAQAHGAVLNGRPVGSWGEVSAFSFYPTKNLGAYGDGGAVHTRNADLAERVRRLRVYGYSRRDWSTSEGRNARLDELQAAALSVQLAHLPRWVARRREIAERYRLSLTGIAGLGLPAEISGGEAAYHLFVITVENRDGVQEKLQRLGVETAVHYPTPVHQHPVYRERPWNPLPNAEWLANRVLSLPCFPELSDDEVGRVIDAVRKATA